MSGLVSLHYARNGKVHDLTLQQVEGGISGKNIIHLNNQKYILVGDLEETDYLISHIQELTQHQHISAQVLIDRLIDLGVKKETIEFPLISKTESLRPLLLPSSDGKKIAKTKELLDALFEKDLPGCNLMIMKDGHMLYSYARGLADYEDKKPMHLHSPQHFASVSKQFTTLCILLLEEEGKLNLDEDIHELLPEIPPCLYRNKKIKLSIRHLLEMRSGLPEVATYAFLAGKEDQDLKEDQKLDFLFNQKSLDLAFAPGMDSVYCNTNYYLLPEIILRASGKTLKEYADENIFKKLGMLNTHFIDPDKPIGEQSIKGYKVGLEKQVQVCTTRNNTWGPCGVIGTPKDMVLWDENFPNNQLGKKNPQLIEALTSPPTRSLCKGLLEYGKGFHVGVLGKFKIESHFGGIEGFTTEFLRVSSVDKSSACFSFFLSSNRDREKRVKSLARQLADLWLEERIFPTEKETPTQKKESSTATIGELFPLQGKYFCETLTTTYVCRTEKQNDIYGLALRKTHEGREKEILFLIQNPFDKLMFSPLNIPTASVHFTCEEGFVFVDKNQGITDLQFTYLGPL